jgi:DNA polymerase III epsilon subunit-like protein
MIVHDYYEFMRFLRAECAYAKMGFDIARDYPVTDTWLLAKQRFPKQRHSLDAVARKVGIESNLAASDALERVKMVARVAHKVEVMGSADSLTAHPVKTAVASSESTSSKVAVTPLAQRSLGERSALCWRVFLDRAR